MSDDDLLAALVSLPSTKGYTKKARYRDFRQLFMGSDQGQRVLSELLDWGHLLQPAVVDKPIDPYLTHVRDGEANIARKLLVIINNEPPEPPQKQTRRPKP